MQGVNKFSYLFMLVKINKYWLIKTNPLLLLPIGTIKYFSTWEQNKSD